MGAPLIMQRLAEILLVEAIRHSEERRPRVTALPAGVALALVFATSSSTISPLGARANP